MADETQTVQTPPPAPPAAEKQKAEPRSKAAKKAPEGVVAAVHAITYGKGKHAPAGSFFVPTSDKERAELEAFGAIRELNDAEARLVAEAGIDADGPSADDNPLG